jgi:hypothetical protein
LNISDVTEFKTVNIPLGATPAEKAQIAVLNQIVVQIAQLNKNLVGIGQSVAKLGNEVESVRMHGIAKRP